MVVAGSSAPASGGEHLVSHLWDMTAEREGREPARHGEQTGVASLMTLEIYDRLLALDAGRLRRLAAPAAFEDEAAMTEALRPRFGDLTEAVLPHARAKRLGQEGARKRRALIEDRWDILRAGVSRLLVPPQTMRRYLCAAGAPATLAEIGVPEEEARFALEWARFIRGRYTVLDLAAELGALPLLLEPALAAVR
jgi:glycerol-1-phosphate dehydrogenase [NAD(P)+]